MKIDYAKIDEVNGEITVTRRKGLCRQSQETAQRDRQETCGTAFRPGHVPSGLIQKKYGAAVKYDIINQEVGNAVFDYIKENKLHVLGNPVPQQNDDFNINAADFTLKFKVGIAPEFDTHVKQGSPCALLHYQSVG